MPHKNTAPSAGVAHDRTWHTLAELTLPGEPGDERRAMEHVVEAVRELSLPPACLERLQAAIAEAVLNAMRRGNTPRPAASVSIRVLRSGAGVASQQPAQGWGFFLVARIADRAKGADDGARHIVELFLYSEHDKQGRETT